MIHRRSGYRRTYAALAAAGAVLLMPSAAGAAESPRPDDVAAVSVYREQIPTASGPRVADTSAAASQGVPLTASQKGTLRQAPAAAAKALEHAATSPAYGAPDRRLPRAETVSEDGVLGAAVEVAFERDRGRLLTLVVALAVVSAVLTAAAVRARRT